MFSPHYFLLLMMFPAILHGFILDEDNEIVLKPPGLSANSLLGWSMAHYNQDMILGAPLESGNGNLRLTLTDYRFEHRHNAKSLNVSCSQVQFFGAPI